MVAEWEHRTPAFRPIARVPRTRPGRAESGAGYRASHSAGLLGLQSAAGNTAVSHLLNPSTPGRVTAGPAVQRCGCAMSAGCSCDEGTGVARVDRSVVVQRQALAPLLGAPCTPYSSVREATAAHTAVAASYLSYAMSMFGPETAGIWMDYLSRALPLPRPARRFATPGGEIVEGFRSHPKSVNAEAGLLDVAAAALRSSPRRLPPNTPVTIPLSDLVAPGTVWTLLNRGGSLEMSFDAPATTIAGNIAGGVGSGVDPDTRNAWGEVVVTNQVDPTGATLNVVISPRLIFAVHDTVDFCPGALGGAAAQIETIPMSRLEATGAIFGAPFAGDVPFDVIYDGPGRSQSYGTSIPTTPAPPAPTSTEIPRRPKRTGPAHTIGTFLRIRSGPGTNHPIVGRLPQRGTRITVVDQESGTEVRGNSAWDRIDRGWVSDFYVEFD